VTLSSALLARTAIENSFSVGPKGFRWITVGIAGRESPPAWRRRVVGDGRRKSECGVGIAVPESVVGLQEVASGHQVHGGSWPRYARGGGG